MGVEGREEKGDRNVLGAWGGVWPVPCVSVEKRWLRWPGEVVSRCLSVAVTLGWAFLNCG